MKLNLVKIVTLIGAISAGGIALADSGSTEDHEVPVHHSPTDTDSDALSAMMMEGGFEHLDRNGEGTVTRDEVAMHHKGMHGNTRPMAGGDR